MKKRLSARRAATFLATLGVLVMSSGIALMVAATPANAADKVIICHATSSDSTPYQVIEVDRNSAKHEAHLEHQSNPNKIWKTDGTFNGVPHSAGQAKPDLIDVESEAVCLGEGTGPALTTASVTFTDPECPDNAASFATSGENATFEVTNGSAAPGASIEVTATANEGFVFDEEGEETLVFSHAFGAAEDCSVVEPPESPETPEVIVSPPTTKTPTVTTPTVVSAGLTDVAKDMRGEQGLALVFAGMLLLLGAGGLGLRVRGGAAQA